MGATSISNFVSYLAIAQPEWIIECQRTGGPHKRLLLVWGYWKCLNVQCSSQMHLDFSAELNCPTQAEEQLEWDLKMNSLNAITGV